MTLPDTPLWSAHDLCARLQEIDEDIKGRIRPVENAGKNFYALKRDIDLEEAKALLQAEGTDTQRKAKAKVFIEGMALYERFKEAEGTWMGMKAALGALDTRASINQSLLKRQD